jgi:cytochrome c oxidase cbb3-type subunit 3
MGVLGAAALFTGACEREQRRFHEQPPGLPAEAPVALSDLQPGVPTPQPAAENPYEANAWAVAEGKRLFSQFNCVGCHAHGGGAIGPPLMDAEWIYGGSPASVYASIVEGRPNGMPSFRGRVTNQQVWQLAAYVRSMSGLVPKDVAPGRSDHLYPKAPELAAPDSSPGPVQVSPGGTRP